MSAGGSALQRIAADKKLAAVSVKALVEFAAKSGSLDRRFTPSPTGQQGIEGHQRVAASRGSSYQSEVSLSTVYRDLLIRGRADGYCANKHCIEEIKTFYGDVNKIPANHRELHWAQAKFYGWMYCLNEGRDEISIAVIYFHLGDAKEHRFEQHFTRDELTEECEALAEKYYRWQQQINARLKKLHHWIDELAFPYENLHPSQRQMAEAVYKAAVTGRVLLAEAPTGTGKTLAGLFPAIKSMTRTAVDKVFYLTAKNTGKQLALENLQLIASDADNPLRVLELTAQEKACLEPELQCHGESCPYAEDFYSKLDAARQAASQVAVLDQQTLAELAREFMLCPFYLSMEMSRWSDIIVADFNYYFDGSPLLLNLTREFDWRPYVLVDESHNLVDRGRQMYSAEIDRGTLLAAKKLAPAKVKKALDRVNKQWLDLIKSLQDAKGDLALIDHLPDKFMLSLLEFTNQYIELLQQQPEHPMQFTCAQELFFAALQCQAVDEVLGDDFCVDMQKIGSKTELLTLRNLVPANLLAQRTAFAHAACFFSATLKPAHFYHTLLGLPDDCVHIQVDSPFAPEQLDIHIAHGLSTRYKDRETAIEPICAMIRSQLQKTRGNALVFFSSYEFLQQVEQQLAPALDDMDVQLITQSRRMSESSRREFIAQFSAHDNLLGLAVLGGVFSEGIDLAGDSLKGVFIATLGLPQLNAVNEHMRDVLQDKFQQGYDFTYLYPGIQKVIQAAGRVIRSRKDTGYLWLLDERFAEPHIKRLLPDWWEIH